MDMINTRQPNNLKPEARQYAHSKAERPVEEWQQLWVHLLGVANLAKKFAADFQSETWAWDAGLLHDMGKMTKEFQAYLRRENGLDISEYDDIEAKRINHSSAGAAFAEKKFSKIGRVLSYLVAGHHAGLADFYACDSGRGCLQKRLSEGESLLQKLSVDDMAFFEKNLTELSLPPHVAADNFHYWLRFLFSCLVDADYLDTESFLDKPRHLARYQGKPLSDLKIVLDAHLNNLVSTCEDTHVNCLRRQVLDDCRKAASNSSGLFSLTVPTGGGKTLASLTFALDHAVHHKKQRIIYVIPYTSIIEQTAQVFKDILGESEVVEHHSNFDPEQETVATKLATENWDASIIVTTNVQFFESLLADRPSRCRKLHNIVNSVVVLDEAQLLPPKYLYPCVSALNELADNYGTTILFATATQPKLPQLKNVREIASTQAELYQTLARTQVYFPKQLNQPKSWDEIAGELLQYHQVLCVVNKKRDCYELFSHMPEGSFHLSALMCGAHRTCTIEKIKQSLQLGKATRVISTQLVEAGVDLDFPVVFRALAGLDSIAQAAGRCNREGKLKSLGQVFVFEPPSGSPPGLLHKGESVTRELLALDQCNIHDPEHFRKYFELFYSTVNDIGEQKYLDCLVNEVSPDLKLAFRNYATQFHLIDDHDTCSVVVLFGKGADLVERLRSTGANYSLLRRLQRYSINLHRRVAERLWRDGLLEEVVPGILAQAPLSVYNPCTGLEVFSKTLPVGDLII